MSDESAGRELLRRFRRTIVLVIVGAVAGLTGALLNSIPCELVFVCFALLAILSGWISAVRAERDNN